MINCTQITKKEFYKLGGFANPRLFTKHPKGKARQYFKQV